MTSGLVSIIIPCYNSGKHIRRALSGVSWQTYAQWECIVVDDGSTDDTPGIAAALASSDPRVRYIRKEHSGTAATRNAGIDAARGEFLQFLDADDILLERKLEECVARLRDEPAIGAVYSEFAYFKPPAEFFQTLPADIPFGDPLRAFLFEWDVSFMIPIHAFLFRASLFENQRFDPELASHFEDVECWIRLAAAGTSFGRIPDPLAVYCLSGVSTSSQGTALLSSQLKILQKYRSHPACSRLQPEFAAGIALVRQRLAMAYFREKDPAKGGKIMAEEWKAASPSARLKMLGWRVLMKLFSVETVADARAWLVRATPFRWGSWAHLRPWEPPQNVRKLLES